MSCKNPPPAYSTAGQLIVNKDRSFDCEVTKDWRQMLTSTGNMHLPCKLKCICGSWEKREIALCGTFTLHDEEIIIIQEKRVRGHAHNLVSVPTGQSCRHKTTSDNLCRLIRGKIPKRKKQSMSGGNT